MRNSRVGIHRSFPNSCSPFVVTAGKTEMIRLKRSYRGGTPRMTSFQSITLSFPVPDAPNIFSDVKSPCCIQSRYSLKGCEEPLGEKDKVSCSCASELSSSGICHHPESTLSNLCSAFKILAS